MKRKCWNHLLIWSIVFIVCIGLCHTEAFAATATSDGPVYVIYDDTVNSEDGVCLGDVACGTPVNVEDGLPITNRRFYMEFSVSQVCTDVRVEVKLPEGFIAPYMIQTLGLGVQRPDYEIKYWYDFTYYTSYLKDAKPGETYYIELSITGNIDLDNNDWETTTDRVPFTQTIYVPFFQVKDVHNTVTVRDNELGTVTLNWDDTIFTSDYNQKAAEMAAVMSKIAYNESAMKQMLSDLGCYSVNSYNMGVNVNQIGYFTGEKLIVKNGETRKVTFAVGRGTNGKFFEWIGNVNLGSAAVHRGFQLDADQLYNTASSLRNQTYYGKLSDSFVFFTGHSQAAAAANIAAHKANNNKWNCVAYTFATPTVERGIGTTTSGEHGIYNWVYYQDVIRNAPSMAQYGRYGSTTIFGFETPSEQYWGMEEDAYWMDSLGVTYCVRKAFTMQEYLNAVLYRSETEHIPEAVNYLLGLLLRGEVRTDEVVAAHSMANYYKAVKNRYPCADMDAINNRLMETNWELLVPSYEYDDDRVVEVCYYCPVNVYVYDRNGGLVGSIEGDQVMVNDENLILYSLLDSKVVMYLESMQNNYRIEVTGYADGTVTHSTTYYSMDGTDEMLVSETIPISNGQTISFNTDPHGDSSYTTYTDEAEIRNVVYDLLGVEPEEATMPFTDVPEGKWYYDYVDYVYQNGLMNGTSDTLFDPTGTMTRAMLATVIYRAAGAHALPNEMPFTDVPAGKWYTDAVNWAYINKIVNGTSDTTFSPNDRITREQIVTMFYRYAQNWQCDTSVQADLNGYSDAGKISKYAQEPFRWAVAAGIINGTTDTTLEPKAFATRAQCAAIMQRFNEYIGQ